MGNPLTHRQHNHIQRIINAIETAANALERIADTVEAPSEAEAGPQTPRTAIERSGRYDELAIESVEAQSVALDYECDPPELIVHADDVRHPTPTDGEMPTHIIELSPADTAEGEG
jgi:hypothetical protein